MGAIVVGALWIASVAARQQHLLLQDLANVAAVLTLLGAAAILLLDRRRTGAEPVDAAVERLALAVERQWRAEAVIRRLIDVDPLAIEWRVTEREGTEPPPAGRVLVRTRDTAAIEALVDELLSWRRRRLVVLGEPGAGKTTLAVLLTLALARRSRRPGSTAPVPVLLSASTWEPGPESLADWLERRLIEDYGIAAGTAADLRSSGRLLPLIDGLDELPEDRMRSALRACNSELIADDPLVVLSRSDEYRTVTRTVRALSAATVVEAQPVSAADAVAFLDHSLPSEEKGRWQDILAHLEAAPGSPLAAVLSSPLMVSLVRQIYEPVDGEWPADPHALLAFGDRAALEDHLLAEIVPAAFRRHPARPGRWRPEQAQRWLTFLAGHLHRLRTRDLAWWRLSSDVPVAARVAISGAIGLVAGTAMAIGVLLAFAGGRIAAALLAAPGQTLWTLLRVGFVPGLILACMLAVAFAAAVGTRPAGPGSSGTTSLGVGAWFGLLYGVGDLLVNTVVLKAPPLAAVDHGFVDGGFVVLIVGLSHALAQRAGTLARADRRVLPWSGLDRGRWTTLLVVGAASVAFLTAVELTVPSADPGVLKLRLFYGLAAGLCAGLVTPWPHYVVGRCWLAATGRLPWRLPSFIQESHRRGLLRQVGSTYQFRHARLQDRLAGSQLPARPVDAAVERLALAVERQWRAEAVIRRLIDVDPLAIEWRVTEREGTEPPPAGRVLVRTRDTAAIEALVDELLSWRRRRLVVLGEPGAGKTTLAVLLTLALARRSRRPGSTAPVPVLLSASTWEPGPESLADWLERRLIEDYGIAAGTAADLRSSGRLLPLIDGLDELPEDRMRSALRACNSELIADDPLVVLSRSDEYRTVTRTVRALSAATVVEAQPVSAADAVAFLDHSLPSEEKGRWQDILAHLEAAPGSPLAAVLSSPLMVSLVRQIYEPVDGEWPADPHALLAFGDRAALEDHLLAEIVPAAFRRHPARPGRWRPEQAQRWLTFLAGHLHRLRTRDLAWWRLSSDVPLTARMAISGLAFAGATLILVGIVSSPSIGGVLIRQGPLAAVATALGLTLAAEPVSAIGGTLAGLVVGFVLGPIALLSSRLARRGSFGGTAVPPGPSVVDWILLGCAYAVIPAAALTYTLLSGGWRGPGQYGAAMYGAGVLSFVIYGLPLSLVGSTIDLWAVRRLTRMLQAHRPGPSTTPGRDRAATLASAVTVGLVATFIILAAFWPALHSSFLLVLFLLITLSAAFLHPWPDYVMARWWLAMTGNLPLRLTRFLHAAHHRGVLVQVASAYRFAHPPLQNRQAQLRRGWSTTAATMGRAPASDWRPDTAPPGAVEPAPARARPPAGLPADYEQRTTP